MELLNEHKSYILIKSNETGVDPGVLESVWTDCVVKQQEKTPELRKSDPLFTSKVMQEFDNRVDMIKIQKARSMIMAKEDVTRSGQAWLDNLASGNYVAAQEHFPKLVKASYEGLLNTRSKEFIKQFTEKLRNNSKK